MRISDWSSDVCSSDLICHTLGGTFDLPHADVHAIVLPYVAEFNASAAPGAMARVAMALGGLAASDAGRCLYDLRRKTCPKQSLASLGMAQSDIRHAAELARAGRNPNPRNPPTPLESAS